MKIKRIKSQNKTQKKKKVTQKGGDTPPLMTGTKYKGPLGLEVGTYGAPIVTVNNAIAAAYSIPVSIIKTIEFAISATDLPSDIGHTFTMDNPPESTNMKLFGGKKKN